MSKEKLEALFERYSKMTLQQLAVEMSTIRDELDEAKATKAYYQNVHDHLAKIRIPEVMEDEGIEVVKIAGVGRLQVKSDIYCSVPAANRDAVKDWLIEHGQSALVAETVNSSSLKAYVKEAMKNGEEYPSDLLKIEPYNQASIVKS